MKIPKKCPKCGCNRIHTETGRDICRFYEDGKLTKVDDRSMPRRIFCDNCHYDWDDVPEDITKGLEKYKKQKKEENVTNTGNINEKYKSAWINIHADPM